MERLKSAGGESGRMGEILLIATGIILYAASASVMTSLRIIPGSVLGIAELLYTLKGIPVGAVNLFLNIPIMAVCVRRFGKKILIYTAAVVVGNSVLVDLAIPYMPAFSEQFKLAGSVLCGAVNGAGCGLIMRAGGSVGGTTAVVRVLKSQFQKMNVTAVMFLTDAVIIITGAVILREVSVLLYSVALSASASFFVDLGYTFGRKEVDVVA